ncbi:MAG TPA: SEC-C metal-binding domain-containing protein, partial [Anaeromyxobacteraceae bacterium]
MGKPGANDPCWCGSGRKYKRCHRDVDEASGGGGSIARPGAVRPGVVSPRRAVPPDIPRPSYAVTGRPRPAPRVADLALRLE